MIAGRETAFVVMGWAAALLAYLTSDGIRDWLITGLGVVWVVSQFARLSRYLSRDTPRGTMGAGPGPSRADRRTS